MITTVRILAAAAFTDTDPKYLADCLAQRQPGSNGAGSRFAEPMTLEQLEKADWKVYEHEAVQPPAIAYRAEIPGYVGVIPIADLSCDAELTLDDRKKNGELEIICEQRFVEHTVERVEHTTLIIGPKSAEDKTLEVYPFFPGDPIPPSTVKAGESGYKHGDKITAAQARDLGFVYAKIE